MDGGISPSIGGQPTWLTSPGPRSSLRQVPSSCGTNIWNASLHAAGLTSEARAFSTIPGMHVVPQADGSWRRELRGPGDVSHVGWPPIAGDMPPPIQRLESALHALEEHRDPCLRGDRIPTQAIVDDCDEAMRQALSVYQTLVPHEVPA